MKTLFTLSYRAVVFTVCSQLFFSVLMAQDIDRKKVNIMYVSLPLNRIPEGIETYAVNIKGSTTSWGSKLGNIYDKDRFKLNGYHLLPTIDDADLVIEVELINEAVQDETYTKSVELTYKKDKNSPEIKYTAYYLTVQYYTPKVGYRAYNKAGEEIFKSTAGGTLSNLSFGNTSYHNHYSNETALINAWRHAQRSNMASAEKDDYDKILNQIAGMLMGKCMYKTQVSFTAKYVDEKKGKSVYQDLLDALDYFEQAIATISSDQIGKINKLIQPEYQKRNELMDKAIALWEKALSEADYDNKKARIDSKVARHLYFNLALAYLWKDDFVKAKEYAQGRKKDVGGWDKNFLAGIRQLSAVIDDRSARHEANKWRKVLTADDQVYVYKDPAQRKREADEALAQQRKAREDSLATVAKTNAQSKKTPTKKVAAKKPGPAATKKKTALVTQRKS